MHAYDQPIIGVGSLAQFPAAAVAQPIRRVFPPTDHPPTFSLVKCSGRARTVSPVITRSGTAVSRASQGLCDPPLPPQVSLPTEQSIDPDSGGSIAPPAGIGPTRDRSSEICLPPDSSEQHPELHELRDLSQSSRSPQTAAPSTEPDSPVNGAASVTTGTAQAQGLGGAIITAHGATPGRHLALGRFRLIEIWSWIRRFCIDKSGLVGKVVKCILAFLAVVNLWCGISAAQDGRKSVEIAKWGARKSFIEICATVSPASPTILCALLFTGS